MPVPSPLRAPPIPEVDLLSFLLDKPGTGYPSDRPIFKSDLSDDYLTHNSLTRRVKQLGAGLRDKAGVKDGDKVMVLALHGLHYPVALLGILCAGATVVPINPALLVADVVKYVEATGSRLLLVGPQFLKTAGSLKDTFPDLTVYEFEPHPSGSANHDFNELFASGEREWDRTREARDRTAIIAFSSGTSGLPKGCEITQANIVANQWIAYHGTKLPDASHADEPHGTVLGAFPPFHVAGIWGSMVNPLFKGNTQIIMSAFTFPTFLALIAKHRPTELAVAPPIVLGLAVAPGIEQVDFSSVKRIGVGAAPLSAELAEKCIVRLRGCGAKEIKIRQVWGMTETVCCASAFYDDMNAPYNQEAENLMSGSVGFPLPHLTIKLVDPVSDKEVTTPGEPGEILVRGPCVFKGYLPSTLPATAKRMDYFTEDGFYRTGDVGTADAEGRLRIVDRIKELIKVSGFQVAPAEIEGVLLTNSLISDCAVIGVQPRPGSSQELVRKGEMVMAFVVPAHTTGKEAMHPERLRKKIHAWYNPQVVGYKRLSGGIRIVSEVPKSPSGKILRRFLRDQIAAEWKAQSDTLANHAIANL